MQTKPVRKTLSQIVTHVLKYILNFMREVKIKDAI